MNSLRHYQGVDFEVWDGQQTWFWFVIDPHREGGAIGAAASENDAVRDACLSIDEMMYTRPESLMAAEWEISLAELERYLMQRCDQRDI
jgi:hypothetical protein